MATTKPLIGGMGVRLGVYQLTGNSIGSDQRVVEFSNPE